MHKEREESFRLGAYWMDHGRKEERNQEKKRRSVNFARYLSATAIFTPPKRGISTLGIIIGDVNSVLHDDASGDIRFHVFDHGLPRVTERLFWSIPVRSTMGSDGKIPWVFGRNR